LTQIFSSLAILLLRHGYGYARISRLAKIAFVDAAISISSQHSSKINFARIATLTGLTRLEVSKLVRSSKSTITAVDTSLNRATRVAIGWQRDAQFVDDYKRPKVLSLTSSRGGFDHLVRKYSGDIPSRAMLSEMMRLGMVRRRKGDWVSLVRTKPMLPKLTVDAVRAISPWVNVLADPHKDSKSISLTSTTEHFKIHFDSLPQVLAATRELESRRQRFMEAIEQLGTTSSRTGKHELTVYVAVAAAQPAPATRKKHLQSRRRDDL